MLLTNNQPTNWYWLNIIYIREFVLPEEPMGRKVVVVVRA